MACESSEIPISGLRIYDKIKDRDGYDQRQRIEIYRTSLVRHIGGDMFALNRPVLQ